MWKYLLELCQRFFTSTFDVQKLHLDFESGAHEAAKEIFPNVIIVTCRFHLGQAWWRKINGDSNLRNAYKDNNNELGQWLKLFFGLPFLPSDEIEDAFLALIAECPSLEEGHVFTDYLVSTYIAPDSLFPPYLWAQEPSVNPRTTNGPESFHRTYNGQFYSPHPPTYVVISVLKETQAQTLTIINYIKNNVHKPMAKKDKLLIESTLQNYNDYKVHKDLILYLRKTGNSYQGKNFKKSKNVEKFF
ncbi:unnamed protein product [Macrosiphum euphorbiae]|uniref:MULE transposase domain-containing protein n=1 Tax=Macrosiphum euphorbiae TaxID=13131 RepID=A0AAV0W0Q8_9HEMI|nr:unnamed protein product [Macrosiphum euphorbiae]